MTKQTAGNPKGASLFGPASNPFAGTPFANAFAPPFDAAGNGCDHAVKAWMQFNHALLEGVGKLQQETSRFVIRRLEEDLDRQQQLLACRSPDDAWQICSDAVRQTVQDYTDEAGRLSEIAAEVQYACSGFGEMLAASAVEAAVPDTAVVGQDGKPVRRSVA